MTQETIAHVQGIVAEHGSDAWWSMEVRLQLYRHLDFARTVRLMAHGGVLTTKVTFTQERLVCCCPARTHQAGRDAVSLLQHAQQRLVVHRGGPGLAMHCARSLPDQTPDRLYRVTAPTVCPP